MTAEFTTFDTAIGVCGLAWRDDVVIATSLPSGGASALHAWFRRRFPDAVPGTPGPRVQEAVDGIVALLGGARVDLTAVPLDFSGVPEFNRRAYEVARAIPPGKTSTYGDIARALGMPGSAQAVGQAMGHNPVPIIVPCHRVLAAGGRDGGFSARGGVETKLRMLVIEGAVAEEPTLF
ncbi:methylated-DNA--[protein]-cysteine S-methyltransferase [Amycolatopsis australiensis]|uniref:methylated-DNA--[protein]-cysteine S-methyltransferase n=1 Tax=Amycolatopsis australiensis TaxID=546364 RepID=A0A1K1T723_9PSEU|nr:methylated-DNA--[protein]-cysteine S-methyltransferase [Amycolatopsis australiensis]SFW92411.1 methylated-DNA-[protein]-cysteine S-methyltransferase [Amycolatopsis australiensis]